VRSKNEEGEAGMSRTSMVAVGDIQKRIYTLRGLQVMLDEELAELYGVETKRLNEQVKRNSERFPSAFMFQISENEIEILRTQFVISSDEVLRSQFATLKNGREQHRKFLPYVFTEQGVAMLSAVLHSETAIKVSIQIMNAFVVMRRFLRDNAQVFQRLDTLELKQIETDKKVDRVLTAIEDRSVKPKQGIFFNGQVFDAWQFTSDLVRSAKKSILLIDNYLDDSILLLFSKREKSVAVTILTKTISKSLENDVKKFNEQYPSLIVKQFQAAHDRFLIIDETDLYHFGAFLKDLGKKWFAFSKMEVGAIQMLDKLKKEKLL
jgi:hypothetical protein